MNINKKVSKDAFRTQVYDEVTTQHGVVCICVPAAGITRDALAVVVSKETGMSNETRTSPPKYLARLHFSGFG